MQEKRQIVDAVHSQIYFNSVNDQLLGRKFCYEYLVDACHHCCYTLVGWVLCSARYRLADTYTARDRRNLSSRLAVDRQKAVEISHSLFFVPNQRVLATRSDYAIPKNVHSRRIIVSPFGIAPVEGALAESRI